MESRHRDAQGVEGNTVEVTSADAFDGGMKNEAAMAKASMRQRRQRCVQEGSINVRPDDVEIVVECL